jgi:hypothetical protein
VVLDPTDPLGEQLSLKGMRALANDFAAESSLQDFDLSRIKSLRTLQVPWSSIIDASSDGSPKASRFLKHVLSTITSPAFFMIIVFCGDNNFRGVEHWRLDQHIHKLSQAERAKEVLRHRRIFEVFREAYKVRDFQLELCVSTRGSVGEEPVRILEDAIAEERAENGFDDFIYYPSVYYNPQRTHY